MTKEFLQLRKLSWKIAVHLKWSSQKFSTRGLGKLIWKRRLRCNKKKKKEWKLFYVPNIVKIFLIIEFNSSNVSSHKILTLSNLCINSAKSNVFSLPSSLKKTIHPHVKKKRGKKLYKNDVERNREKLIEQEAVNSNRPRCYFDLRSNSQFTKKRERRTERRVEGCGERIEGKGGIGVGRRARSRRTVKIRKQLERPTRSW